MTNAQLTCLAAEKVMGWTVTHDPLYEKNRDVFKFTDPATGIVRRYPGDLAVGRDTGELGVFDPLNRDEDSMMLWDRMVADGWWMEIQQTATGSIVSCLRANEEGKDFEQFDRNRRRAILVACLRAVSVDV